MNDKNERGVRFRTERSRLGFTQAEAGKKIGVSREMVSRYESGAMPGDEVLERMRAAGFDVGYVLGGQRYKMDVVTTVSTTGDEPPSVHRVESPDPLEWRDVLIIAVDELRAAGLSLPGEKLAEVVDLLMEFQKHGLATTREAIRKQIRLVA